MTRRPIPVFPFPPCARPECRERAGRAEPPTMPRLPAAYAYSAPNGAHPYVRVWGLGSAVHGRRKLGQVKA